MPREKEDYQVCLPVCVLPGNAIVEVPLERDTTALDVIEFCLRKDSSGRCLSPTSDPSPEWWTLVADFQGFEKRFNSNERLYQLIRKHILLAENVEGVRFYLQRKKKRFSLCSFTSSAGTLNSSMAHLTNGNKYPPHPSEYQNFNPSSVRDSAILEDCVMDTFSTTGSLAPPHSARPPQIPDGYFSDSEAVWGAPGRRKAPLVRPESLTSLRSSGKHENEYGLVPPSVWRSYFLKTPQKQPDNQSPTGVIASNPEDWDESTDSEASHILRTTCHKLYREGLQKPSFFEPGHRGSSSYSSIRSSSTEFSDTLSGTTYFGPSIDRRECSVRSVKKRSRNNRPLLFCPSSPPSGISSPPRLVRGSTQPIDLQTDFYKNPPSAALPNGNTGGTQYRNPLPRSMFQQHNSAPQLRQVPGGQFKQGPPYGAPGGGGRPTSVQPPLQHRPPHGPPNYAAMSYGDLVQYAEDQRQRIEANNAAIRQKEAKLRMLQQGQKTPQTYSAVQSRLKALRAEVTREDAELARLRKLQGELDSHRELNITAKSELGRLQQMFSTKEKELRDAVTKVETLRGQLDQLQRRRQSAANAAVEMATKAAVARDQKLAQERSVLTQKRTELRTLDTKIEDMLSLMKQEKTTIPERPKAAVEPFHRTPPQTDFGGQPSLMTVSAVKTMIQPAQENGSDPAPGEVGITSSKGYMEALTTVQRTLQEEEKTGSLTRSPKKAPAYDQTPGMNNNAGNTFVPIREDIGKVSPGNASLHDLKPKVQLYKPSNGSGSFNGSPNLNQRSRDSPSGRREPVVPPSSATAMVSNSNIDSPPNSSNSPPRIYATTSYIHSAYTGKVRGSPQGSDHSSISSTDSESLSGFPGPKSAGKQQPPPVAAKPGSSKNRRLPVTAIKLDAEPPDLIPQSEKSQFGLTTLVEDSSGSDTPTDKFYTQVTSDKLHIRSDNLRARKRTSWAREATNDETEHIRNVLRREQQKGRSNIHLSWIFREEANKAASLHQHQPQAGLVDPLRQAKNDLKKPELEVQPIAESRGDAKPQTDQVTMERETEPEIRPPPPYPFHLYPHEVPSTSKVEEAPSSSSEGEAKSDQITVIDVNPDINLPPAPAIGILKKPGQRSTRGRIEFDPLAMLLDAALEGELDLVKKSAKRIKQVSLCNDEGITALHNAICAGHYEIVRFLVDANGDVNAQDSDGWTPLHCAASCNNLPMVKFLVERGSCVFATTVSDHETPADKCEEEEDGFDGCYQFLLSIQEKLGHMNEGEVFSAYSYDAENPDELGFEEGDSFKILNRNPDSAEIGWWWARHKKSQKEGYVPRNYLALYPRLCNQASHVNPLDTPEAGSPSSDSKDNKNFSDFKNVDSPSGRQDGSEEEKSASTDTLDRPNVADQAEAEEEYEINIIEFSDDDKQLEDDDLVLQVRKTEKSDADSSN